MDEQQLSQYIDQLLRQGFSELDIRGFLQQRGWQPLVIDAAFRRLRAEPGALNTPPVNLPSPVTVTPGPQPSAASTPTDHTYGQHRLAKLLSLLAVIVVLIAATFLLISISHHRPSKTTTTKKSALSATDAKRQNDIAIIRNAVATYRQYAANALPQTTATAPGQYHDKIYICGTSCSTDTPLEITLGHYANKPTAVSFREYSTKLKVPNADTVYIVDNAVCNAAQTALGSQSPGKVAILYALQPGQLTPKCTSV